MRDVHHLRRGLALLVQARRVTPWGKANSARPRGAQSKHALKAHPQGVNSRHTLGECTEGARTRTRTQGTFSDEALHQCSAVGGDVRNRRCVLRGILKELF